MGYKRITRNFSREQVLENLRTIVTSEYFRQYQVGGSNSGIETDHVQIKGLGAVSTHHSYDQFTLGDVSGCLDAILHDLETRPEIGIDHVSLSLYTPRDYRKKVGLTKRAAEGVIGMGIKIKVIPSGVGFEFNVSHQGLSDSNSKLGAAGKIKAAFTKWYAEVDKQVEALPHPPAKYSNDLVFV